MLRPEAYARSLEVVRAVAAELARAETPDDLAGEFGGAREISARAAERTGVRTDDLDLELIAGAGFALRYREVLREGVRAEAIRRISQAREAGERWVVVTESGKPTTIPYVRLDMYLPGADGIRMSVDADAETGSLRYTVETMALDPVSGEPLTGPDARFSRVTFGERADWDEAYEELRARTEGPV
jgi:hypothetical protein